MVIAGHQNSRNPNLQVAFAHAWYVCSQHSIGRPLRMNGTHRTQSDNSRVRKGSWILKNGDKVWKYDKKSLFIFFFERCSKCFISGIFFVLVKSYAISPVLLQRIMKKLCSCVFLKVSIDHLCGNLESGKRNCCFWKKSRKFSSKNLNEPFNSRFDLLSRRSCRHSPTFGK